MILADTSAWVEFDRATGSPVDLRMLKLVASEGDLAVTEPVIMAVCSGAKDDHRESDLRRLLGRCAPARLDPVADFDGAVSIHRSCRRVSASPRAA